ncbi:2TM domain-containing protein [Chloroflexota bacterium]
MTTDKSEEQIYEEAKKRVRAKRRFWGSFIFYGVVNAICFFIWALSGGGYPWFLWVLGPWGILFVFPHYLRVFVLGGKSEKRAIEKEVERIKRE